MTIQLGASSDAQRIFAVIPPLRRDRGARVLKPNTEVLPPQQRDSSLQKDQADEPRFQLNRYGLARIKPLEIRLSLAGILL